MRKIGVLVPQSKSYPGIGRDFTNGIKSMTSSETNILVEGIGIGDNVQVVCDKIDKLVLQEDVDGIVALVGDNGLITAYEKVNELQVPTVFARMGAYPDIQLDGNRFAYTLSYGLCDSLRFLGEWLPRNGFEKVGVSGSFNDAGYGFLQTLEGSLYENGGGFTGHFTPPLNPRDNEAEFLAEFYSSLESDAVCQLYNGVFAEENIQYLESINGALKQPLFFMPFALNHEQLMRLSTITKNVYMVATWLPVPMTGNPTAFDVRYYEKHQDYPTVSALLGYKGMEAMECIMSTANIQNIASSDVFEGHWNTDLRFNTPFKIWKLQQSEDTVLMVEHASSDTTKRYNDPFEGQEKGWHNAYLCY